MQPDNNRNLLVAVALSLAILFGFNFFVEKPRLARLKAQQAILAQSTPAPNAAPLPDSVPSAALGTTPVAGVATPLSRDAALQQDARVPMSSSAIAASINLRGGLIDDVTLRHWFEDPAESKPVVLLNPARAENAYYAELGWTSSQASLSLPGTDTLWRVVAQTAKEVTLQFDAMSGLQFERRISLNDDGLFTITDTVKNAGSEDVSLNPYALLSHRGDPVVNRKVPAFEGAIGLLDNNLRKHAFNKIKNGVAPMAYASTGGWLGLTSKYWLAAFIPAQDIGIKSRVLKANDATGTPRTQIDMMYATPVSIKSGESSSVTTYFYAGAKKVSVLESVGKIAGAKNFDKAVDFGIFYFLTKPFFDAIIFLGHVTGNYGIAILIFTVCVRLVLFPLASKQYVSMNRMRELQPKMAELREKYKDDKTVLQTKMMEMYQREKVSPFGGCLPMLLQIPIFLSLYKVLIVSIELRHAPFYGWIHDLSAADPTSVFNLFGVLPYQPWSGLPHLGVWPLLMGVTMFLQTKMQPKAPDPTQQQVMMMMPFIFTFMMAGLPAGVVIYWTWGNLISMATQWAMMKRHGTVAPHISAKAVSDAK